MSGVHGKCGLSVKHLNMLLVPKLEYRLGNGLSRGLCSIVVCLVAMAVGVSGAASSSVVNSCETLQAAFLDKKIESITVNGSIALGDCEWDRGKIPGRLIEIVGVPSASIELVSGDIELWKLGMGMKLYFKNIILKDPLILLPKTPLETSLLTDFHNSSIDLKDVALVFPHCYKKMSAKQFLKFENLRGDSRVCDSNGGVVMERMVITRPGNMILRMSNTLAHCGILLNSYGDEGDKYVCLKKPVFGIVTMYLFIGLIGTVAVPSILAFIGWAMVIKLKELEDDNYTTSVPSTNGEAVKVQEQVFKEPVSSPNCRGVHLGPVIGKGTLSTVYDGDYRGQRIAVKVFDHDERSLMDSNEPLEAFLSSYIDHRNVVKSIAYETKQWDKPAEEDEVAGIITTDPCYSSSSGSDEFDFVEPTRRPPGEWFRTWLVMEYCDQGSLHSAIRNGVFYKCGTWEVHNIILTAIDVAAAMDCLHSKSVIHGDLKTQNVLLCSDQQDSRGFICKVGDFGFSRLTKKTPSHIDTYTCGTVRAMPPELLKDGVLTLAADVYSYGIMLWELLAGTIPYKGWTHQTILHNVVEGIRPEIPDDWPKAFAKLIHDCLQQTYVNRPNFEMIIKRLEAMKVAPPLSYDAVQDRSFEIHPGFNDEIESTTLPLYACALRIPRIARQVHFASSIPTRFAAPSRPEEVPPSIVRTSWSSNYSDSV